MEKIIKEEIEQKGIPFEKQGRQLVWHDEFDGTEIDREKWAFDRSMNGGDRIYDNGPNQIRVENGNLVMRSGLSGDPEKPFILPEGILTFNTMLFKYGYLEMRGRVPFRHGAWPAFWMQSATPFSKAKYFAEYDIFEIYSSPNTVSSTLHKWGPNPNGSGLAHAGMDVENKLVVDNWKYVYKDYSNLCNEYHTYGFEWDEKSTKFYVDGEKYADFPIDEAHDFGTDILPGMAGFHDFAYVIFNNELFTRKGSWRVDAWNIQVGEEMPIEFDVDYIRLYQRDGEEIKFGPEIMEAKEKLGRNHPF